MCVWYVCSPLGVLRRALSAKITTKKVNCLCMALGRLHNYRVNQKLKPAGTTETPIVVVEQEELDPLVSDNLAIVMNGGVEFGRNGVPNELLHGGEHFDDVTN
jgi:hypothetical protein